MILIYTSVYNSAVTTIYSEEEQKHIYDFWKQFLLNKYSANKSKLNEAEINAYTQCEINGFGRKFLLKDLANEELKNKLSQYFKNFNQLKQEGKGLFFFGESFKGKTLAATYLAKNIYRVENPYNLLPFNIKFFLYDDLVRLSYDDKSYNIINDIIKKTDILVIDNLGNETGLNTQARSAVVLLDNIIRNRDMMNKITWITTIFTLKQIEQLYSHTISKIIDENFQKVFVC